MILPRASTHLNPALQMTYTCSSPASPKFIYQTASQLVQHSLQLCPTDRHTDHRTSVITVQILRHWCDLMIIICQFISRLFRWWGAGMVICLERDADLHVAQLMPLPLTVSCFSKIQIGFTFLVPAHLGSPRKRAVKRVCVCIPMITTYLLITQVSVQSAFFSKVTVHRAISQNKTPYYRHVFC